MTRVKEQLNLVYHGIKTSERAELFADVRSWLAEMDDNQPTEDERVKEFQDALDSFFELLTQDSEDQWCFNSLNRDAAKFQASVQALNRLRLLPVQPAQDNRPLEVCRILSQLDWCVGYALIGNNQLILDRAQVLALQVLDVGDSNPVQPATSTEARDITAPRYPWHPAESDCRPMRCRHCGEQIRQVITTWIHENDRVFCVPRQSKCAEPDFNLEPKEIAMLPDIEIVSAKVHEAWIESKRAQGINSRKSESGEELMVPYEQLSEAAKELDRGSVKAVYAAIEAAS